MNIRENVSLAEFTTMKTGGNARYFFCVNNVEELKEAVSFAKNKKLPTFVLGAGSNTIVSDSGFAGVVIKMEIKGFAIGEHDNNTMRVIVGAGVEWDEFVASSVRNNLYGIENLSAIPGSVGAAPVQNIGAYGVEVSDTVAWVDVFDTLTMENYTIPKEGCFFGYRDSFFKTKVGKEAIITRVALDLKKHSELNTSYDDVRRYFSENNIEPTLRTVRDAIIKIRDNKLPNVKKIYSAGSFFKNPVVPMSKVRELEKKYKGIKYFALKDINGKTHAKLSVAWVLDNICNAKSFKVGKASVYDKHALVLINEGGKKTKDILLLAEKMRREVKLKTGVNLEREVNLLK